MAKAQPMVRSKSSPNRLYYTVKLSSSLLKENNYSLNLTFEDCLRSNLIISLSDSQMLSSIRHLTSRNPDLTYLESLYQERDSLKASKKITQKKRQKIRAIQSEIYSIMYIPEYITVLMESTSDYDTLFHNGFTFNSHTYHRASCSASQARVSTIVFVDDTIRSTLLTQLNCGRDLSHPLAASKFNAYFGLYSSASKPVTKPRFCIIPDYESNIPVDVDWSIEQDWDIDDIIEPRTLNLSFNRFDGSGMVTPSMADQWASDLALSYTPSQFCIRTAFTKGLVNIFDFQLWCQDELTHIPEPDRYFITDIYGERRDIREIDVVLTEGMAKLWDSWPSQQAYESCCTANHIDWRITKYSPEMDKECSTLNYQYIQTLNPDTLDTDSLISDTVSYIQGVTLDDPYYTLLFSLGQNMTTSSIQDYMTSSDNYWIKSAILNHSLLTDRYSREKIRDMITSRIEQACLGRLISRGNYQAIVPDNYALCQHMTGQPVTGLLEDGEFYSRFWAERNVDKIACARSPMCSPAEWVLAENKYK